MIVQINAIELAISLARDEFKYNETMSKKQQESFDNSELFRQKCDWYMEMITNAQDTSLNNPIGSYFPISYISREDITKNGFDERLVSDEQIGIIAARIEGKVVKNFSEFIEDSLYKMGFTKTK